MYVNGVHARSSSVEMPTDEPGGFPVANDAMTARQDVRCRHSLVAALGRDCEFASARGSWLSTCGPGRPTAAVGQGPKFTLPGSWTVGQTPMSSVAFGLTAAGRLRRMADGYWWLPLEVCPRAERRRCLQVRRSQLPLPRRACRQLRGSSPETFTFAMEDLPSSRPAEPRKHGRISCPGLR